MGEFGTCWLSYIASENVNGPATSGKGLAVSYKDNPISRYLSNRNENESLLKRCLS